MTITLSPVETDLVKACVCVDDQEAIAAWLRWVQAWESKEPEGWLAAPHAQLNLLVAAYHRLRVAGLELTRAELLTGMIHSTWASTAAHLGRTLPVVDRLQQQMDVVLLKGAALIASGKQFGERRISDVDIVIRPSDLPAALAYLRKTGYRPLYGASFESIASRLATRRDGWNFEHESGSQLDLHWRLFDVNGRASRADARLWQTDAHGTILSRRFRIPPPAFNAVFSTYHATTRGTPRDRLQNLVDLSEVMQECSVAEVLDWARDAGVELETGLRLQLLDRLSGAPGPAEIRAWTPRYPAAPRRPWEVTRPRLNPTGFVGRRRATRSWPEAQEVALVTRPFRYRAWEALGRPAVLERFLVRHRPITRLIKPDLGDGSFDFSSAGALDLVAGPGWAWTEPGDNCTWTDRADGRLLLRVPPGAVGRVDLKLAAVWNRPFNLDGNFSANPRGVVYVNGREAVRYDLWNPAQTNPIAVPLRLPDGRDWAEISIRPDTSPNPRRLPPVYAGWKRSLPVEAVTVVLD